MEQFILKQKISLTKKTIGIVFTLSLLTNLISLNFNILFIIKLVIVIYVFGYTKSYIFSKDNNHREKNNLFGLKIISKKMIIPDPDYLSIFKPNDESNFYLKLFMKNNNKEIFKSKNYDEVLNNANFVKNILDIDLNNPFE